VFEKIQNETNVCLKLQDFKFQKMEQKINIISIVNVKCHTSQPFSTKAPYCAVMLYL